MTAIYVCIGSACHLKGSYDIVNQFKTLIEKNKLGDKLEVRAKFCMGNCGCDGVCVCIDEGEIHNIHPESAETFFNDNFVK